MHDVTNVTGMLHAPMAHWFADRIEQLCKELKTTKSQLGLEAGLSHATIGKWVRSAEAGEFSPRLREVEMLASYTGKPAAWFLFERPPGMVAPGSLAAADEAARKLTKYDNVPEDDAWLLMRQLVGNDADTLYFEARAILSSRVAEYHQRSVDEIKAGATPRRSVKTS